MLEHVSANQTRFVMPGLYTDSRGVALGKTLLVLLPSIERVVALFRGLSETTSIDELIPSLRIIQVRTPLRSHEFFVTISISSSHIADTLASIAKLVDGLSFTGATKHFIKYRDTRSPLGYDVDALTTDEGDYILYAKEFVQTYIYERDIDFHHLVQRLSLNRDLIESVDFSNELLLRVEHGLWRSVVGYLHRNLVKTDVAAIEESSADTTYSEFKKLYLIKVLHLPKRMVALFKALPGVEIFQYKTEEVLVELGFEHPIDIGSVSSLFDSNSLYLYSGSKDAFNIIKQKPQFVSATTLVHLDIENQLTPSLSKVSEVESFKLPFKLVESQADFGQMSAVRIDRSELQRFKQIVYLMPPNILEEHQIALTHDSIFLYVQNGNVFFPLGEMFYEYAPGVFISSGYRLTPRVMPLLLKEHLGPHFHFFCRQNHAPLSLNTNDFRPLGRFSLANYPMQLSETEELIEKEEQIPRLIVNESLSVFPLWGFDQGDVNHEVGKLLIEEENNSEQENS